MHEASLVEGLLKIVGQAVNDFAAANPGQPAPKVAQIICDAGLIACFEPEALRACFEIFAEGTAAEGAELIVDTAPLPCQCRQCGEKFELTKKKFVCPFCESPEIAFSGGNGLVIQAINIVNEDKANE